MPTVHISLPEKKYRLLKQKAAELGIQVTDLIKLYINDGLMHGFGHGKASGGADPAEIRALERRMDDLENKVRRDVLYMKGKVREIEEMFLFIMERMDQLEEIVDRVLRQRTLVTANE
ncbi:MAG: hypothetical protein F7C35_04210 [Desulfurococcales archaeon]|nr:hypothetical protein [Desulfurococcales archaeon]